MKRRDLIEVIDAADVAMAAVVACWEQGDLAGAVRELARVRKDEIKPALDWWSSDGDE